jgi:hypothetical protein
MKRTLSVLSILILLLVVALTAQQVAAGDKPPPVKKTPGWKLTEKAASKDLETKPGKKVHYRGLITNLGPGSLTINLADGSSLSLSLDTESDIKIPTLGKTGSVADLLPGMQVTIQAEMTETGPLVRKLMVIPSKPSRVHRVGEVTAYTPGQTISILAIDGQTYAFKLATDVKILPEERVEQLQVGAWVTIIAPRDVTQLEAVAYGIVVHPAAPGEDGQ